MATLKVDAKAARKMFAQLGYTNAKAANSKKLVKLLEALPDKADDLDQGELDKKGQRLLDQVSEAVAKERNIEITGDDDDDDDDEKPAKKAKGKGKKAPKEEKKGKGKKKSKKDDDDDDDEKPKKKKKGKKREGGGGPSNKDKVFELWLKSRNPGKDVSKWAKKFPEIMEATIRGWVSNWKKGPEDGSFPRQAEGRSKEIKAALKAQKSSD